MSSNIGFGREIQGYWKIFFFYVFHWDKMHWQCLLQSAPPFCILSPVFLVHLLLSLILPVGASFIQESTSQGLCGLKIVPEERLKSLLCILNVSERSNPQSSASMDKDSFILIILVNSHSITLISYYVKKCIWFLLCLIKDTFFPRSDERKKNGNKEKRKFCLITLNIYGETVEEIDILVGSAHFAYWLFIGGGTHRCYHTLISSH